MDKPNYYQKNREHIRNKHHNIFPSGDTRFEAAAQVQCACNSL